MCDECDDLAEEYEHEIHQLRGDVALLFVGMAVQNLPFRVPVQIAADLLCLDVVPMMEKYPAGHLTVCELRDYAIQLEGDSGLIGRAMVGLMSAQLELLDETE